MFKSHNLLKFLSEKEDDLAPDQQTDYSRRFIAFLSTIFISQIYKTLEEKNIFLKHTVDDVLYIIDYIKKITIRKYYEYEKLTQNEKYFLDIFECPYPIDTARFYLKDN
jgi:hypothetical protein